MIPELRRNIFVTPEAFFTWTLPPGWSASIILPNASATASSSTTTTTSTQTRLICLVWKNVRLDNYNRQQYITVTTKVQTVLNFVIAILCSLKLTYQQTKFAGWLLISTEHTVSNVWQVSWYSLEIPVILDSCFCLISFNFLQLLLFNQF